METENGLYSLESEKAIISTMLMSLDAVQTASESLAREDFKDFAYADMFTAIVEMYNEGMSIDLVTFMDRMKAKGRSLDTDAVKDLVSAEITSIHIKDYIKIVKDKSILRSLVKTAQGVIADCCKDSADAEKILDRTEKKLSDIQQKTIVRNAKPIRELVVDTVREIDKVSVAKGNVTGIPTGFHDIDYMTQGLQKSDLILVAARPAMGKTALALNMAAHMAFRCRKHVVIFSLEMPDRQLMKRLLSMETHIDLHALRSGNVEEHDWKTLMEATNLIGQSTLIIDDTAGLNALEIKARCRQIKAETGLDAVLIDYLQLMGSIGKSESRQQEISKISRELKNLARELDVPVIALSQLSRAVEQRADHRPMLSDLRESGAIEQDADIVMFLYRESYYNEDAEEQDMTEVIIAKHRNGPVGTVKLVWKPAWTQFQNPMR